jgi:cytochrome P450
LSTGCQELTNFIGRSFAFWYLARYPRVQDKLRAELLECPQLALDALPDECTHTILAGLPYLDAVTNEL